MAQFSRSRYLAACRHCLNVAALEAQNQFGRLYGASLRGANHYAPLAQRGAFPDRRPAIEF